MEFVTDISSLRPNLDKTFNLVETGLPTNIDVYFRAKQKEIIDQYYAARLFMREVETDDWSHWFKPLEDQQDNKAVKLIFSSYFYETALNLKQITYKLNAEFTSDTRKLVFWYDEKAEFADDIGTLDLAGAKVYHLEPDNQFYTKHFLERVDRETSYLIYAPFPKPSVRDNHLEDTLLYSKQFFADRASLLAVDLGIDEKYKPVIQKYIKFFGAKDRTQKFYDLEIENFTRESIEVALMSLLCKTRTASFDEVLRVVMTEGDFEDNRFLAELAKYDLLSAFWRLCEEQLGYTDVKPTLEKLVVTMFITYTVQAPSLQTAAEDVAERIQEKDTTLPAAALEKTDRTAVVANTQAYKVDVMKIDLDADWEVATGYGNHQGNGYIPLEVQRNYAKNKAVAVEVHLKPEGKVDVSGWEVKHVWRY